MNFSVQSLNLRNNTSLISTSYFINKLFNRKTKNEPNLNSSFKLGIYLTCFKVKL